MIFTASLPNLSHGWGQQEDRADPLFALALRFCSSGNTPEAPVIQLCTSLFWWFWFFFFQITDPEASRCFCSLLKCLLISICSIDCLCSLAKFCQ